MMKRLVLLFVLINFLLHLMGQQEVYFNKRIDHYGNYDYSRNILVLDSGYMIAGFTEDTSYLYNIHLSFTGMDTIGDITSFKEFGYDSINMFLGNPGSLIRYSETKYLSVGTKRIYTEEWVHDQGMLGCYNTSFDTLWTKYYGEGDLPNDTAFLLYQVKRTQDSKIIMTGIRLPIEDPSSIWLMETDSLGNKLWETFIGGSDEYYYQGHSVVQTADGGYVIGAVKFKIESTGGSMDPLIIKTDSLGNEEWRINPGNPDVDDNKVMVALSDDGSIIAGTNYGTLQSQDNRWAVNKIMKITLLGQIIWDYNYCETAFDRILLNTIVTDNGNIITNGVMTIFEDYNAWNKSWILCVDSTGNQLWYREYALLESKNSFNDLLDVKQTSDNGLIGCGMVMPVVPDTGTVDIWVMKMDSLGCLEGGCDTTVGVNTYHESAALGFSIYPVPADDEFTVAFAEETATFGILSFYDMFGTKVDEIIIPAGKLSVRVSCPSWSGGIYFARLSEKGGPAVSLRFVVNR